MIASKTTVSSETLHNSLLSQNKRQALRQQAIVDYVNANLDKPLTVEDLLRRAHYQLPKQYTTGWAFVNRLIKQGVLSREEARGKQGYYWSAQSGKVTVSKPSAKTQPEPLSSAFNDVEKLAKSFAWYENSDSLREFIKWLSQRKDD